MVSLLIVASLATSCSRMDYAVRSDNFRADALAKNPALATLTYRYSDTQAPYEVTVRKVPRGYAMEAPVYDDPDMGMESHFTVSRTREFNNFVGMQTSFSF
ncbi:MAG: hypothetical protein ACKVOE_03945 [Rickettsiales bacterium]